MYDKFTMSVGQAHELEMAFDRNGWNATEVKKLSKGDFLTQVRQVLLGKAQIVMAKLLKLASTVQVSGATKFVAANHFTVRKSSGIQIAWLNENFKLLFLGKIEKNVEPATLNLYWLAGESLDAPILAELGERAETSLAHLVELLKKQPNGESGSLLTDGYANIFYIRGTDGNLWPVFARWRSAGWCVHACSVEYPWWRGGRQVCAR